MAWLSTHNDTNKIVDDVFTVPDTMSYTVPAGAAPVVYQRSITTTRYRHVGMTEAAADTCRAALDSPPATVAQKRRENDAGAYAVDVMTVSATAWTLSTTTT